MFRQLNFLTVPWRPPSPRTRHFYCPRTYCSYSSPSSAQPSEHVIPSGYPLFYSDIYEFPLPSRHRFPMHKYRLVRTRLQQDPRMRNCEFHHAPLATRQELERAHSASYVQRVLKGTLTDAETRAIGLPWSLAGVQRALGSTGGTIAAARAVCNGAKLAAQTAGGTHHARRDSGAGFCVFNDLAVATEVIRNEEGIGRVLILDLDVHQGEGTADIFGKVENVFCVSLHGRLNYPFEKVAGDLDVGFEDGVKDEEYLRVMEEVVPRVLDRYKPEFVLLQMGVDTLEQDGLGRLSLSREGLKERNRMVYKELLNRKIPGVITMGGGYSKPDIEVSVEAHCDTYTDIVWALDRYW